MLFAIPKKLLIIFITNIENVNCVLSKILKRYYEKKDKLSNQRKIYDGKNRNLLLAKSKLNQRNRKYERKKLNKK